MLDPRHSRQVVGDRAMRLWVLSFALNTLPVSENTPSGRGAEGEKVLLSDHKRDLSRRLNSRRVCRCVSFQLSRPQCRSSS